MNLFFCPLFPDLTFPGFDHTTEVVMKSINWAHSRGVRKIYNHLKKKNKQNSSQSSNAVGSVRLFFVGGSVVLQTPPACWLPHNCTADALTSTGASFWNDHFCIFRCWNLRVAPSDWLCRPHDNLARKCSRVLSPIVSLEGSWGGFGGLGDLYTLTYLVSKGKGLKP